MADEAKVDLYQVGDDVLVVRDGRPRVLVRPGATLDDHTELVVLEVAATASFPNYQAALDAIAAHVLDGDRG